LEHGADVNAQGVSGITPLILAFTIRHFDVATLLVTQDANVQVLLDTGATALDACVLNRAPAEFVKLLLSHGAQANAKDKTGVTPLHRCAMSGTAEAVAILVEHGADVHVADTGGMIPLSCAAMCGNAEMAAFLISKGSDVNHKILSGETPLHLAVIGGTNPTLTQMGTEANLPLKPETVNHMEVARLLLSSGADANARDNEDRAPLYFAITENSLDYIRILASSSAQLSKVHKAESALYVAVRLAKKEAVKCLIELGADVNEVVERMSLLRKAQSKNNTEIAALLIEHGAK
jgi:ankyrin repeat protein